MPLQENTRNTHTRNLKWSGIFCIFQPSTTSNQGNSCFQLQSSSKPSKKKEVPIKKTTFHPYLPFYRDSRGPAKETVKAVSLVEKASIYNNSNVQQKVKTVSTAMDCLSYLAYKIKKQLCLVIFLFT